MYNIIHIIIISYNIYIKIDYVRFLKFFNFEVSIEYCTRVSWVQDGLFFYLSMVYCRKEYTPIFRLLSHMQIYICIISFKEANNFNLTTKEMSNWKQKHT